MVARARTSVDRPLSVLLDEVRSSIDYYRNQPGSAQLRRVVVTGGSAQLPGLPERLSALVGVPVEPAYMHDLLRIGDIGFAPEELPRLEPYLPGAGRPRARRRRRRHGHRPAAQAHRGSASKSRGRVDQHAIIAARRRRRGAARRRHVQGAQRPVERAERRTSPRRPRRRSCARSSTTSSRVPRSRRTGVGRPRV